MSKQIFDNKRLVHEACEAYDRMHDMANVYEGTATQFNERQFVFELGARLRALLIENDPTQKHPWVAYEYHYPRGSSDNKDAPFDQTECDIVAWEKDPQRCQWIEVKSTGVKNGAWRNNFKTIDKLRREDLKKLRKVRSRAWGVQSSASWVWLHQTVNYPGDFASVNGSKSDWCDSDLDTVLAKLGKPNEGNTNLPKLFRDIAKTARPTVMRIRTDLKTLETTPPGGQLTAFVIVCSV